MTVQRDIDADTLAELSRTSGADVVLGFLTITHPNLPDPIRVVNDVVDYVKDGYTFVGVIYEFLLLTDDESTPSTQLSVPNVDRKVMQAVRRSHERANVTLEICSSVDFDLTVTPRQEIGSAAVMYSFAQFNLVDIEADVQTIRGKVMLRDYAQEPWPSMTASRRRLPGLWR